MSRICGDLPLFLGMIIVTVMLFKPNLAIDGVNDRFSIVDFGNSYLFHGDYSPPTPPPPSLPPFPSSASCEDDLQGFGSLESVCKVNSSLELSDDLYITGSGNLEVDSGVIINCPIAGCSITVNLGGEFQLGSNASVVAGALWVLARNVCFLEGSVVNVSALGGAPPSQTSGTPVGLQGAGGGHGGRGANCLADNSKLPEDVWGGDAYAWSEVDEPWSFGSRGGTTSKEEDYGGGGGGRIRLNVTESIEVSGSLLADGGNAGTKGGGGSGGSVFIAARKMTGNGRVSASGGDGFAGGGGGRVSINIFSRHDDQEYHVHGGRSFGCPKNAGAAGTFYDSVPRRLIIDNHNLSTDTNTLLLEFPNQPLWTNVYIQNQAKATVPLFWSRVQVQGQLSLSSGAALTFGLAHYASSAFELIAEELLMSDSMIKESSAIHSSANLGVHGQGYLNLTGPGNVIEAQRLVLSLSPQLYCDRQECPVEIFHPPEDCCIGGVGRGNLSSNGLGGGGGHGGRGGDGYCDGKFADGGGAYGDADLPCELGSGSGNSSLPGSTAGGGIIVMGSLEHSLPDMTIDGSINADGQSYEKGIMKEERTFFANIGPGGGSGGTVLLFVKRLVLGNSSAVSAIGGSGSPNGGGGGGGGRVHFHWSDIPVADEYQPIATVSGSIIVRGGLGRSQGHPGEEGTVTGKECPVGLHGIFCEECPVGTFKNVTGSDAALCLSCPANELPDRGMHIAVRGGVTETPCPYKCISDRYHMPHCRTTLEELVYTFGGPWWFGFFLLSILILLALVLSVARMKFASGDDVPGLLPNRRRTQLDHSFPFLESLNEVMETNRNEEAQSHVHRMYFLGPNTFSEPWHLSHSPPDQVKVIVYEDAFIRFVDEINGTASYQWWEGSVYSILSVLAYPLAWSWLQWCRKKKLQRLREFVRSEYDHSCLRSCRSRALYEGLKLSATPDLMLAYLDFYLGGDEKRSDLPPCLNQRLPLTLIFGGDGSYMAPFSLHNDNVLTSLISQSIPPTVWYRLVAGLNAQLRLVRRGQLKLTFEPVVNWLEVLGNPVLITHGLRVDLAWFQPTTLGYSQFGLVVYRARNVQSAGGSINKYPPPLPPSRVQRDDQLDTMKDNELQRINKKISGCILQDKSLHMLKDSWNISYPLRFIACNTKPAGHQDLIGLALSMLLLGDFSLVVLTLIQLYSTSLLDFFLVLFVLPLGILLPFPAGINALFSRGPRKSAGLARIHALWNFTSFINVITALICGIVHYKNQPSKTPGEGRKRMVGAAFEFNFVQTYSSPAY
ncbi:Eukaryotic translation initiation factor 3 subunit H [Bienertia sinuspersici]